MLFKNSLINNIFHEVKLNIYFKRLTYEVIKKKHNNLIKDLKELKNILNINILFKD